MIQTLRRRRTVYGAFAALVPKLYLAYSMWVWVEFFVQILTMVIFVYFWRAVYANSQTLNGLTLAQTLNYILLAQVLMPAMQNRLISRFGQMIRHGEIAVAWTRPVDLQGQIYVEELASLGLFLLLKVPLVLLAWLFFGLELPSNPAVWGAFALALLLGQAVVFCFDWLFACLAFYSTETWGLSVVREGVASFFSGALVPLAMLPDWLRGLTEALPFAQGLYVPISLLSGITPLADAPRLWLTQGIWLVTLLVLSRVVFAIAARKVTVQGG